MINILSLFGILIIGFLILFRLISKYRSATINALDAQRHAVQERYDFMIGQKRGLTKEIEVKEQRLASLKNKSRSITAVSVKDLDMKENQTDKLGRYLLAQGKITMKQHEKALQKMTIMKMDYLGVCLSLGFIDIETSSQALRANK